MKVQPLNYTRPYRTNNLHTQNNKNNNAKPSFGNLFVSYSNMLENGGFIAEFLSVDTLGMMGPRTGQGFLRNHEKLGHLNYRAGREEAVRELLSGPAYYYVPLAILTTAGLLFGRTARVNSEVLKNLHKVMKNVGGDIKNAAEIKQNFVKKVMDDAFDGFTHERENIDKIGKIFNEIVENKKSPASLKEWFGGLFRKKDKNGFSLKKSTQKAEELLTSVNKANGKNLDNTTVIKVAGENYKLAHFMKDVSNYLDDFTQKAAKTTEPAEAFIDKFHKKALTLKHTANVLALSGLSAFLIIIPKLYKTGESFPGMEGLEPSTEQAAGTQPAENAKKEAI